MRVLIAGGGTGGHLMPALALARALVEQRQDVEPVLVGARRGVEAELLPQRPYRYHLLPFEPIYRRAWWRNLRWPVVAWRVLRACRHVLDAERPVLVVGTGGYASGPLLWLASRRGLPVALQEQNAYPGVATRLLARYARQIHLGFPEAAGRLRAGSRTEIRALGNPIEPPPDLAHARTAARRALGITHETKVLFVMGGSQGALRINQMVQEILQHDLLPGVTLLWSTGPGTWKQFEHHHSPPLRHVRPFWDPIGDAYAATDLVVSRAGAMTTAELCAWALPSILVPLPTAAAAHQAQNASALDAAGAALSYLEPDATAAGLARRARELLEDPGELARMRQAAQARGRPNAASEIALELLSLVS